MVKLNEWDYKWIFVVRIFKGVWKDGRGCVEKYIWDFHLQFQWVISSVAFKCTQEPKCKRVSNPCGAHGWGFLVCIWSIHMPRTMPHSPAVAGLINQKWPTAFAAMQLTVQLGDILPYFTIHPWNTHHTPSGEHGNSLCIPASIYIGPLPQSVSGEWPIVFLAHITWGTG